MTKKLTPKQKAANKAKGITEGKQPMYRTPLSLQKAIDKYIKSPPTKTITMKDGSTYQSPHLTITGLCYELGFASRQSFYDYEDKPLFTYTIKRARLYIESVYEANLHYGQCTGSIFALKNMGWHDTQSIELREVPLVKRTRKRFDGEE